MMYSKSIVSVVCMPGLRGSLCVVPGSEASYLHGFIAFLTFCRQWRAHDFPSVPAKDRGNLGMVRRALAPHHRRELLEESLAATRRECDDALPRRLADVHEG